MKFVTHTKKGRIMIRPFFDFFVTLAGFLVCDAILYYKSGIDEIACNCNSNDYCVLYDCSNGFVHRIMVLKKGSLKT